MRSVLVSLVCAVLLLLATGGAQASAVGADLSRPANNTRTCETGFFDPALIAGTGFPYQSFASCTWWSTGSLQGAATAVVPFGGGTVKRIRVKVGGVTGRMQVVALRLMRHPGSLADPACCFPAGHGPVFVPAPNATTELAVDIPVKHETDPRTGIVNYDVLALSVLDAGVPVPAHATSDSGFGGLVAGMFPAYVPGEERTVGYGTVMAGHVLLQADIEPPPRPPPPPPPPSPPIADAVVQTARATVRKGSVGLTVSCTAAASCRGALAIERAAAGGATAKTATKQRRVIYGRASIAIPANSKRTVRVVLSRQARKALRGKRGLRAVARVTLGANTVTTRTITLKAQRPRTRR